MKSYSRNHKKQRFAFSCKNLWKDKDLFVPLHQNKRLRVVNLQKFIVQVAGFQVYRFYGGWSDLLINDTDLITNNLKTL